MASKLCVHALLRAFCCQFLHKKNTISGGARTRDIDRTYLRYRFEIQAGDHRGGGITPRLSSLYATLGSRDSSHMIEKGAYGNPDAVTKKQVTDTRIPAEATTKESYGVWREGARCPLSNKPCHTSKASKKHPYSSGSGTEKRYNASPYPRHNERRYLLIYCGRDGPLLFLFLHALRFASSTIHREGRSHIKLFETPNIAQGKPTRSNLVFLLLLRNTHRYCSVEDLVYC